MPDLTPGLTLSNNNESPQALPPVPLEGQPTPTMMWQWAFPRAPETKHPQTLVHQEETQWTPTWIPLEIASPAQILIRYP